MDLKNPFSNFRIKRINVVYDAGLPDITGPKPMVCTFYEDRAELSYMKYMLFKQTLPIYPIDILELELGVQDANTTANAMTGMLGGGILMGKLGALALGASAANRRKEDRLHLVLDYDSHPRPVHFQDVAKSQKLYKEFERLFNMRDIKETEPASTPSNNHSIDMVKQLKDLHELLVKGILTQEEFDLQKKKILS